MSLSDKSCDEGCECGERGGFDMYYASDIEETIQELKKGLDLIGNKEHFTIFEVKEIIDKVFGSKLI